MELQSRLSAEKLEANRLVYKATKERIVAKLAEEMTKLFNKFTEMLNAHFSNMEQWAKEMHIRTVTRLGDQLFKEEYELYIYIYMLHTLHVFLKCTLWFIPCLACYMETKINLLIIFISCLFYIVCASADGSSFVYVYCQIMYYICYCSYLL
jgi:hypothetical protein